MRAPNFTKLSTPVLEKYKKQIEKIIKQRSGKEKEKSKLLKKFAALAKKQGLSLDEVVSGGATTSKTKRSSGTSTARRGKLPPRYANPADKNDTWSGRGRKPAWIHAHLKAGKDIEELAV